MPARYALGLDLGRQADFSALALLRWEVPAPEPAPARPPWWRPPADLVSQAPAAPARPSYAVPTLQRWPLGTPYLQVAADLVGFLRRPPLDGANPLVVLDATGVGVPVCELVVREMAAARLRAGLVGVTITGGSAVTHRGSSPGCAYWNVAKKQLVSVLQVLLGEQRLRLHPALEMAPTLTRELETFSVKITAAADETFEAWREADKDDLVLAVALACWGAATLPWPPPGDPQPSRFVLD